MAFQYLNKVKVAVATAGTEEEVALGSTFDGFQSFASAGAVNGTTTHYVIEDPENGQFELGLGTYNSSGPTFSRTTVIESSNGGSRIPLSGAAYIAATALGSDMLPKTGGTIEGDLTLRATFQLRPADISAFSANGQALIGVAANVFAIHEDGGYANAFVTENGLYGNYFLAEIDADYGSNFAVGHAFYTETYGKNMSGGLYGHENYVNAKSGGSISTAVAMNSQINNTGAGTITTGRSYQAGTPVNSGGGTFTTHYDFYAGSSYGGAATRYGVYIGHTGMNYFRGGTQLGTVTVATLPSSPVLGMQAVVTDANSPSIGSTVTGGGAANAMVWYNGTNWTVTGV